jgi:hypothetical protein
VERGIGQGEAEHAGGWPELPLSTASSPEQTAPPPEQRRGRYRGILLGNIAGDAGKISEGRHAAHPRHVSKRDRSVTFSPAPSFASSLPPSLPLRVPWILISISIVIFTP